MRRDRWTQLCSGPFAEAGSVVGELAAARHPQAHPRLRQRDAALVGRRIVGGRIVSQLGGAPCRLGLHEARGVCAQSFPPTEQHPCVAHQPLRQLPLPRAEHAGTIAAGGGGSIVRCEHHLQKREHLSRVAARLGHQRAPHVVRLRDLRGKAAHGVLVAKQPIELGEQHLVEHRTLRVRHRGTCAGALLLARRLGAATTASIDGQQMLLEDADARV
mmetsp:Transcript_37085/g.108658  ORF Transcript_37085/g.108658 Transcript_37085/m.108658 type:complete len:216 (-) Transcript_37085:1374-2021(-)